MKRDPREGSGVLMLVGGLNNGGAERQMALLCDLLGDPYGASVISLTDGPYRETLESAGVNVRVLARAFAWDVRPAWRIWQIVRAEQPRIVHAWGWMAVFSAWLPCRLAGIPIVNGSIRTGAVPKRRGRLTRIACRIGDVVVANSQAGLDAFGIGPKRGRVVYNGFATQRIDAAPRGREPFSDDTRVVVMAARMSAEKDFDLFLSAARELCAGSATQWRFIALGEGPDRERIIAQAADLIESGSMEIPEPTREVIAYDRRADIGVLFTHSDRHAEGISNSIMEYMACGLPVVCSDGGGNPELVVDGVTGFIVPSGDLESAVTVLRKLAGETTAAVAMGQAGADRIHEEFSVERLRQRMIEVYGEAEGRRSGRMAWGAS